MPAISISESHSRLGFAPTETQHPLSEPQLPRGTTSLKMQGIVQLTFINDKEDIRWLNAGNAARHRHPIFTGLPLIPLLSAYSDNVWQMPNAEI